jgi:hypothetical protein
MLEAPIRGLSAFMRLQEDSNAQSRRDRLGSAFGHGRPNRDCAWPGRRGQDARGWRASPSGRKRQEPPHRGGFRRLRGSWRCRGLTPRWFTTRAACPSRRSLGITASFECLDDTLISQVRRILFECFDHLLFYTRWDSLEYIQRGVDRALTLQLIHRR